MSDVKKNTFYFNQKREEGQNPFTGFMSFQHFRGEKLYSDIIVEPKNRYTETERVECYPVSPDAEENGREEGYYPDTSIVYIRVLWKEFEPQRGAYNYKFIQDIVDKARAHGQTLIFRLMAHSTRASDDVPEWLKEIIPCPERPDMERVKDSPTDPRFMEYFLEAVRKIGERFDDDPIFDMIDISLPGAWGEGHNLHLYPADIFTTIVDTYTSVFKKTRLVGQVSRPALLRYANEKAKVGWRGDGFGEPRHTFETYPKWISEVSDLWKSAPVSFESYWWLGEWKRKGWDIDEIIRRSLEWHISSFNPKSIPVPYEWKEKVDEWISKMGYHFVIESFTTPESANPGEQTDFTLIINNIGVAPIYNKLPLILKLKNNNSELKFITDADITEWMPGMNTNKLKIALPENVEKGEYDVEIGIFNDYIPMVYFATDAERDGSCYKVGKITVV